MRFGICAGWERLSEAAEAGFDFAEIGVRELMPDADETAFASAKKKFSSASLPVEAANCFLPGTLNVTGPTVDTAALRRYMDIVFRRAGEVGLAVIVFGSGGARRLPEGFPVERGWEQLDDAARMAAEIADRHGVTIVMEPLRDGACNFFLRVDQGAAMVDRVAHPRLKLLADLFHMHENAEPLQNVAAAGGRLAHIHLATPAIPETGEGAAYDFPGFFAALQAAGYDGRVSLEDNPKLLQGHEPPLTSVYGAVLAYLKRQHSESATA